MGRVVFRGIDPDGLIRLAGAVDEATDRARDGVGPVLWILRQRGFVSGESSLAAVSQQLGGWGTDTAATLRWRADTIRSGQNAGPTVMTIARARFAADVPFSIGTLDESLRAWIQEWRQSEEKVGDATRRITGWLSQGWTDWDVTNNDLHNIQSTLEALTAAELNRVLLSLSPTQIERWIAEMGHGINGFSLDEQRGLFDLLASNASGEVLGRIHEALASVATQQETIAFGISIRDRSGEQVIVDFVAAVVAADLSQHRYSGLAPAIAAGAIETSRAATSLSRVLAGHNGSLELLITDLAIAESAPPGSSAALATTLSRASDPRLAAELLASLLRSSGRVDGMVSARGAPTIPSSDTHITESSRARTAETMQDDLLDAATHLINSDANAVIEKLATGLDRDGELMTSFWHLLADRGAGEAIGDILVNLRGGDTVDLDRFCDIGSTAGYDYAHARNLAFAAATLERAFTSQAEDAKDDIDAIVRVSSVLMAAVGLVPGASKVIEAAFGLATERTLSRQGESTKKDIDQSLAALGDQIRLRLFPADLPESEPPGFGYATRAWLDVVENLSPR